MFKKFTNGCVNLVQKYLPDAFIFAIILSIITFFWAMFATGQGPMAMVMHWGNGVWNLLAFTMQMVLVLVLGSAFANSAPIQKLLQAIASKPKTPGSAIVIVTLVSAICCWLNWGFGLVVGALLAKEVAKKVKNVDYRLLIASAYSGFVVWHPGASGSVPLALASNAEEVGKVTLGALTEIIPVSETLFSTQNLIMVWLIILTIPFINRAMHPSPDKTVTVDPKMFEEEDAIIAAREAKRKSRSEMTPAEKLENSVFLSYCVVVIAVVYLVKHFANNGFVLSLNIVNLIFLTLGIAFHKTPMNYINAIGDASGTAGGIILQFPFYAGIMGMMVGANADGVSLASVITNGFIKIATTKTFGMITFWVAGVINMFVPSGGGQWAVQGPITMPAGIQLGCDPGQIAMAIAWGDSWTNMLQPFWALPALGIAKLGAKDIMGYCVVILLYVGIIVSIGFLLW